MLSPDAQSVLQEAAQQYVRLRPARLLIIGRTDSTEARSLSASLSERRRAAVSDYLMAMGVPASVIRVSGLGVVRRRMGAVRSAPADACPLGALGAMTGARVFPFPPPRPSTFDDLDPALFGPTATTFGDIERRLTAALRAAGYPARSYFATCGGFAMVTRVERVRSDGRPFPEPRRFVSMEGTHSTIEEFSLAGIIRALTSVEGARFRVIVFLVTDQLIAFSDAPVDAAQAERWVIRGNTNLAPSISRTTLPRTYYAKALIYEFRKTTAGAVFVETTTPALAQLRSANIRIGATP